MNFDIKVQNFMKRYHLTREKVSAIIPKLAKTNQHRS